MNNGYRFQRGQQIWVRNLDEILKTLDAAGKLEGLPFMPEMAVYCGQPHRVYRLADKTCVEGYGFRQMSGTVFLEGLRCDGTSHGGCQRGCLMFWKEAWLSEHPPANPTHNKEIPVNWQTANGDFFICQSTALSGATSTRRGTISQFLREVQLGEMSYLQLLWRIARAAVKLSLRYLLGRDSNKPRGILKKTVTEELNLQPGEWVEVKTRQEIEATLDENAKNRGLTFEEEMLPFCGKRFRVARRIDNIIHEETGRMVFLKHTVFLENVICVGACAQNCPRANLLYWREIWLKRVAGDDSVCQKIESEPQSSRPMTHLPILQSSCCDLQ